MAVFSNWGDHEPDMAALLLMLSGDVARNPGPVLACCHCGVPFKKGITPLPCSHPGCTEATHKQTKCSSLTRKLQTTLSWLCPVHVPPLPAPPAVPDMVPPGHQCAGCGGAMRRLSHALSCDEQDCDALSHSNKRCGGVGWRTRPWRCKTHRTRQNKPTTPPGTSTDRNQSLPNIPDQPAQAIPKRKCKGCSKTIARNLTPVCCRECNADYHKKCSGLTRDAVEALLTRGGGWTCPDCAPPLAPEPHNPGPPGREVSEPPAVRLSGLRILQYNANGLSTKLYELTDALRDLKIDICAVQETKLRPGSRLPAIKGYATYRGERTESGGGGLALFIREGLVINRPTYSRHGPGEIQSLKINVDKGKWLGLHNIYYPPTRDVPDIFTTEWWPRGENDIIVGDLNAHSPLWDDESPEDERGRATVDWASGNGWSVLNDGSPTRVNPGTGGLSSPDLTMAGHHLANKIRWTVGDDFGSDHRCIINNLDLDIGIRPLPPRPLKWRNRKVDWGAFTAEVETRVASQLNSNELSLKKRNKLFTDTLIEAAHVHVGKARQGKRSNRWRTPEIDQLIRRRNQLRRDLSDNREEWVNTCRLIREKTSEARSQIWKDYLDQLELTPRRCSTRPAGQGERHYPDMSHAWRLVRSLANTPDCSSPTEALCDGDKTISSHSGKAEAFGKHYARICKLTFTKRERATNRKAKRALRDRYGEDHQSCSPISERELSNAIGAMRSSGAAGPDDIPPSFLKALGPLAREELLHICNLSLKSGSCPQAWRNATIIPILKKGKPATKKESFRPISLTSCVAKVMERIIHARIYHLAESGGWIGERQAGFRRGFSCEDQITRLVQAVSDGFQAKKSQRAVVALLDYSKAFDTVWTQRLLTVCRSRGLPGPLVRWLAGFLENRQARVLINGVHGRYRKMRQGVPQGAVLSPLLFVLYAGELAERVPDDVLMTQYADDVALVGIHHSKELATEAVQRAVTCVGEWSREVKLTLNPSKSEVALMTNSSHEARWSPTIDLDGVLFRHNPTPKLLGVTLDRTLSFGPHIADITARISSRNRLLTSLSARDWGWGKDSLRSTYMAMQKSILTYAGAAWLPFVSDTGMANLERCQNRALRLITGQTRSSPTEALRLEANLPSVATVRRQLTAISMEKALRLPNSHPRRLAAESSADHRLKRNSWRRMGLSITGELSLDTHPRRPLIVEDCPPWLRTTTQIIWRAPEQRGPDNQEDTAARVVEAIRAHEADRTIYTDGSAQAGTTDGGAALVVTAGDPADPRVIDKILLKGAPLTSSYEEELRAMEAATVWLAGQDDHASTLICSDSQSLLRAIEGGSLDTASIRKTLAAVPCDITLMWVPAHVGIPGNEMADEAAKTAAAQVEGPGSAVSLSSAVACIKRLTRDPPTAHPRLTETYKDISHDLESSLRLSRKQAVMLARLRSGHWEALRGYQNMIDPNCDATCRRCGEEKEDVEHVFLTCPATLRRRHLTFGPNNGLEVLTQDPASSMALASWFIAS